MNDQDMTNHLSFMQRAIDEARKSTPEDERAHPRVGAVVVNDGKLLAAAYRGELGIGEHAEYTALERKLEPNILAGSTVYATLEPCTSRNPPKIPCAERLVERKVKRVFIGILDPNPNIQGNGVRLLQGAGVDVQFFPKELSDQIHELNREFIRCQQRKKFGASPVVTPVHLLTRSLDDWYTRINSIYWNRNFHHESMAIFTHLVEVIGGMSQLASSKEKPGGAPETFVPKALAWWMALCGKVGVISVSDMLWSKFPGACAYCHVAPHDQESCQEKKQQSHGPDWEVLARLGSANDNKKPQRIREWQRLFSNIYPVQQTEDYGPSFARLTEELGELAESLRVFRAAPGYFLSEASDVFAWLMHIQNIIENKARVAKESRGNRIENEFSAAYPDMCLDCREQSCSCPPILPGTVGRIAHEVPKTRGTYGPGGYFMTSEVAAKRFGPSV